MKEATPRTCPKCHGTGLDPTKQSERDTSGGHDEAPPCPVCFGTGEVRAPSGEGARRA
jgi:DnaJ-class molecular chaperone